MSAVTVSVSTPQDPNDAVTASSPAASFIEASSDGPVLDALTPEDATTTTTTDTRHSLVITIATVWRRIKIRAYVDNNGRMQRIEVVSSWGRLSVSLGYRFGRRFQLLVEVITNEDGSLRVVLEEMHASVGALSIIYRFRGATHTSTPVHLLQPHHPLTLDEA
ncbi:hypothetical protein ARMGADRAFT_1081483 [Armillaria gallica]|uniref:Uncharacterized protein n=1 Tax=Armillaria gallica TaxID=47427 RepID=A0A2H3DKC4_ARMGA|nr:hypothetical protein ARMGADRAFT_1039020 [Armillaria gallica]PBK91298.1 hypothetical protein ARMGADRAFT_1081483 [Armillaria gallica]